MKDKVKWTTLLMADLILFFYALQTGNYRVNILVIALALFIYKNGSPTLFKEYDQQRKEKAEAYKTVQEAAQTAIKTKKIFKKEGESR